MESGWDPDVKKFLLKILNTTTWTLMWMLAAATTGIYFQFAYIQGRITITNILFYSLLLITGFFLVRYLYKSWNEEFRKG